MLRILAESSTRYGGTTRRELLRAGGLGALGLLGGRYFDLPATAGQTGPGRFGQARSLVIICLYGGPPQTETFDMKPEGPAEARPFRPISTVVPNIDICEYLPLLANVTNLSTIVRSFTHADSGHGPGLYTLLTGWPHPLPNTNNPALPDDNPHHGSVIGRLRSAVEPVPPCMIVGGRILPQFQGIGQTGGFLGGAHDPVFVDHGQRSSDSTLGLLRPHDDIPAVRLNSRRRLLEELESGAREVERLRFDQSRSAIQQSAFRMLTSPKLLAAFDLDREPDAVRDSYGRFALGENLLLARRLVEAGVPAIQVSDIPPRREHHWDLHYSNIFDRLKDPILPSLDQAVAAFLKDLNDRGLLDETLVVVGGEFGRTPWMDKVDGGRNHWPRCYSMLLAGGGIRRGEVLGASDKAAAYPASHPVAPWDLGATILHLCGIDPAGEIPDRYGQPRRLCLGKPIKGLL